MTLGILLFVVLVIAEFFIWAGVVAVMAWAFSFAFSWSYVVGVCVGVIALQILLNNIKVELWNQIKNQ